MNGGSSTRPYIDKVHPEPYAALTQAAKASRTASIDAGLEPSLLELVNTRVSQINGCVTCLSIHAPAARKAGVDEAKLDLLPAWRDTDVFTPLERAALALAEALTTPQTHELAAAQSVISELLSPEAYTVLEWAIVIINAFNRLSIASGHPPRRRS